MKGARSVRLHASCVALEGRGLLILGPSGSGKSSLALQMIGLGAALVADDQVDVTCAGDALVAAAPPALAGLIEARGVGLLRAGPVASVPLHLAVDLGQPASPRLPDRHGIVLLEKRIALVEGPLSAHLPVALLLYLRGGRHA
ncbi:MAG: HPr kinase/phosphorylase [Cereibacter sp.]